MAAHFPIVWQAPKAADRPLFVPYRTRRSNVGSGGPFKNKCCSRDRRTSVASRAPKTTSSQISRLWRMAYFTAFPRSGHGRSPAK
jgi:hypothetical protein